MKRSFAGKTAIVTGAASGIGYTVARHVAERSAHVIGVVVADSSLSASFFMAKAAVVGLTRVLSLERAPTGITVDAVSPTVVETPLGKAACAGEKAKAQIPVGRFAQPDGAPSSSLSSRAMRSP